MEWARENVDHDWDNVVFSDESSFWAWTLIKRAWSVRGSPVIERIKHPIEVHVWVHFNVQGFCIFTDNLNAQKMLKLYQRGLLVSVKRWFHGTRDQWVLQEDNDPKHRSRLCTEWKARNGINVFDWSPDANPIENVWSFIKHKLRGKRILKLKTLVRSIRKISRSLPVAYAETLVESMHRRCQAILDNGDDWTYY